MPNNFSHTIHNIQALRAVAAILVIMHHAFPHYMAMGETLSWIQHISAWGFAGVDIFFIISGFIMAYTTFTQQRTLHNGKIFFKHRLFRIFLGYWPFFIAMFAIIYIVHHNKLTSLDIVGSFFLIDDNMFKLILPVSWSLTYELYFYFLFVFTFVFSVKQLYLLIPTFTLLLLAFILYMQTSNRFPNSFFYSPFLLEFFAGVLLYMYKDYLMKLWLLPLLILGIYLSYNYGITHESKNGILRIATFGTGAFLVVLTALLLETKHIYRSHRYFEILGNASYTLYLSHLIILELFWMFGLRNLFNSTGYILPLLGFISIFILCIVFSLIYYHKIERPLYKKAIGH